MTAKNRVWMLALVLVAIGMPAWAVGSSTENGAGPSAAPMVPDLGHVGVIIDFTADPTGLKPNGWSSVATPMVRFSDSVGAELRVADFNVQSIGNALEVQSDTDGSRLIMDFTPPMIAMGLVFGNDDPAWSCAGDEAVLRVYNAGVQVGESRVVMNRNDLADQTILFSGAASGVTFDRAVFWYNVSPGGTCGNQQGLIEIVDNVVVITASTLEIPTLGTVGFAALILLLGAAAVVALRRRRTA